MTGGNELAWVKVFSIDKMLESIPALKNVSAGNMAPLANTVIVLLVILLFALRATKNLRKKELPLVPSDKLNAQTFGELIVQALSGMLEESMGHDWVKFLPLLGTLGIFILFSNISGLFPGMLPPTDGINTTAACALIVFFTTHIVGIKTHGFKYVKQFTGPFWWLAWLMIPLEIISHLARPLSLSLRLFGNIMGDHMVFTMIVGMVPFLVPVPVLVLGLFVSIVQAVVFLLLSTVYISGALSEGH
ncbi:F0F1 ATP synthase subunit A [Thermodesulfobacteriota bacterium]